MKTNDTVKKVIAKIEKLNPFRSKVGWQDYSMGTKEGEYPELKKRLQRQMGIIK